jgi:MFS family permease
MSENKERRESTPAAVSPDYQPAGTGTSRDTWSILFLASIFFLSHNGRSITAPLLPALETDLGLSHADSGGLFIFLASGYVFSLLGAGFVSSLIGHRRTIILSAIGVGLALMIAGGSHSVWALRIGLIATGLSSGLYLPSGIAALTSLAKPAHWGRAIGIHDVAPNLSIASAPALAGMLLSWASWRGVYLFFGVIAILVGIAFIRFGPPVPGRGQTPNPMALKSLLGGSRLWIICILFCVGAAGMIGTYNMLPLYLTSVHGFEPSSANLIVGLSRVPGIGMALMAGWVTDRVGPRKAIAVILAGSGFLTMLIGVESDASLMVVIFLQAAVATCFFPAGLAAVSILFPFELRSLATAIATVFAALVGSGLISALMGLLADEGMFRASLVINGIIVLAGLPSLIFLRFKRHGSGSISQ